MSETRTYVFPENGTNNVGGMLGYLAPLLQRQGLDPNVLALLNNNKNGNGWNDGEGFLWLLFLLFFVNGGWGNGYGNGFGGNGIGANALGTGYLSNQLNNDLGRDLLMQSINGNGDAIRQLSTQLNCSIGDVQQAVNSLNTQILQVGNAIGMNSMQIVNAVQSGNAQIASQLANCCCNLQGAIKDSGCQIQQSIATTNTGLERGFSNLAFETQKQTCSIEKAINDSTAQILAGQAAIEKRELQREIAALQEEKQTFKLGNMIGAATSPILAEIESMKCKMPKTETIVAQPQYVPVNTGINVGLQPYLLGGCGYGNYNYGCTNGSLWG